MLTALTPVGFGVTLEVLEDVVICIGRRVEAEFCDPVLPGHVPNRL